VFKIHNCIYTDENKIIAKFKFPFLPVIMPLLRMGKLQAKWETIPFLILMRFSVLLVDAKFNENGSACVFVITASPRACQSSSLVARAAIFHNNKRTEARLL